MGASLGATPAGCRPEDKETGMKKTADIDLARLAADMRRAAEALDRVSRRGVPVEELLLDALGSLGTLSAYRLVKVTRRGRERVYAGLRALEASGRIRRTRE